MSQFTSNQIYLNEHIQTYNFTPEQMDRVKELSKKYNMCEAILLAKRCHCCGQGLSNANEFCSDECQNYCKQFLCLWGIECVFCDRMPIEKCDCHICCIDDDGPANLFNHEHGMTYGKSEFELLTEYAKKTGMDLLSATKCSKKCRDCEEKLEFTGQYGQEHCDNCNIKYKIEIEIEEEEEKCQCTSETLCELCAKTIKANNICFWGKDCEKCSQFNEEDRNNSFIKECVECYKTMTDHEGYGENDGYSGIICNLCAAEYEFDEQELIYNYAKKHDVSLQQAAIHLEE